jgi:hypothetical protein
MKGRIKFPMEYFNVEVITTPAELGQWMKERSLTKVWIYERGCMSAYTLVGYIAKPTV